MVSYADIESAAAQIAGVAHETPVATSRTIDAETGARFFFKCENLQRAGAFKFRGAYNALSRLNRDERARGVVTYSSGNHAQAIALAGQILNIPRVIVMPSDAPAVKRIATEAYGGEVVLYDRDREDREAIGKRLAAERGLTLVPPYDHPHIIAGQGTAARELIEEVGPLDLLYCPCGGGGLLSGTAVSAKALDVGLPGDRRRAGGRRRWGAVVQGEDAANCHEPEDGGRWRAHSVTRRARPFR
jgi:threonine dehydratase